MLFLGSVALLVFAIYASWVTRQTRKLDIDTDAFIDLDELLAQERGERLALLEIAYQDEDGLKSRRTVEVQSFHDKSKGALMRGYCRLRREERTFRLDRIESCIDVDSGEVVRDTAAYLRKAHHSVR